MKNKQILFAGVAFMALGVLMGAFGAHALKTHLSTEMMQVYKIGVEYQFYHALGLLLVGLIGFQTNSKYLLWSALSLGIGIILFSGSLYAISISGVKVLGAITPIGGLALVAGWIFLAMAIWKR